MPPTFGGAAAQTPYIDPDITERFSDRARALFYARLAFLGIGLAVLAVPSWSQYLGTTSPTAFLVYFAVIAYSVANYLFLDHPRFGRPITFITLVLDLLALMAIILPSGGLKSPMMPAHVMFTCFFALLFPRMLSLAPPLLMLPIMARLDALMQDGADTSQGVFLVVWYATLSIIAAYMLMYLNQRDERRVRQLRALAKTQEENIITQERLRLAREIHDGLGGSLSTLIIQAEFIQRMAKDNAALKDEITELKTQAEEAIDELRRSLTMMRRDFDLHKALEDYCMRFQERSRVWCSLKVLGRERRLPSEMQLAIFRILQECLTNIQKHAKANRCDVQLKYDGDIMSLIVGDDGVGFETKQSKKGHYGLSNIEARAVKFRGTVAVQSAPGAGTKIHVTLVVPFEGSHVAFLPSSSAA